jgi:hydroxymethylbilane synthase
VDSQHSLVEIGGRGAFTESIERAIKRKEIDFAVHSLKDLPVESSTGLLIAAVVGPRNPGEVLVSQKGKALKDLEPGSVVGTSSLRRRAQLLAARPDLRIADIRGNVETRIEKVMRGDYDATVLAAAGVERLGLLERVSEYLETELILSAPGQGAVAVQCRDDDPQMIELLAKIDDAELHGCTLAERSFLSGLGGGCSAPVAALAVRTGGALPIRLTGRIISLDGSRTIQVEESGIDPRALGMKLAKLAMNDGAAEILKSSLGWRPAAPLSGKRVVVTRPRLQNAEIIEMLERQGAEAVEIPVVRTVGLDEGSAVDEVLDHLARFDWIVFTSRNAVEQFSAAAKRRGVVLGDYAGKVAAVGPSTAAAMAAAGLGADLVARGQTGRSVAEEMVFERGDKVLHPCAKDRVGELHEVLSERGAEVTEISIYRTESLPIDANGLSELQAGVDWVLFTSGSTVRGFVDGVRAAGGEALLFGEGCRIRYACIGPTTAKAARDIGLLPVVVADSHTADGLVAAMIDTELERKQ